MHPITRCPVCGTLFRLAPDQLRMAAGWARCGECSEVFDAAFHVLKIPDAAPTPADRATAQSSAQSLVDTPLIGASAGNEQRPSAGATGRTPTQPQPIAPPVAPPADAHAKAEPAQELFAVEPDELRQGALPGAFGGSFRQDPLDPTPPVAAWKRLGLIAMSVALGLGLLLQVLRQERDLLHTLEPRLKPWLAAMCVPLKCTLAPLRRIESIVVQSATFTQTAESFRLSLTLKNTAQLNLAAPALELTLSDAFNQPVLRRVFSPTELNLPATGLAAQSEWSRALALVTTTTQMRDAVAGYQLLTFYP